MRRGELVRGENREGGSRNEEEELDGTAQESYCLGKLATAAGKGRQMGSERGFRGRPLAFSPGSAKSEDLFFLATSGLFGFDMTILSVTLPHE